MTTPPLSINYIGARMVHRILRLQIIQNQAARILTKTQRRDHITEVLIDLHWLKNEERIVYKFVNFNF